MECQACEMYRFDDRLPATCPRHRPDIDPEPDWDAEVPVPPSSPVLAGRVTPGKRGLTRWEARVPVEPDPFDVRIETPRRLGLISGKIPPAMPSR